MPRAPILLHPKNYTPIERTPWGSDVLGHVYKSRVDPEARGKIIGESWEVSCDPALPSQLADESTTLDRWIAMDPSGTLSPARIARGELTCPILVKLLSAAQPLSLQVHPRDDDPNLADHECGKPESWYILRAKPGAGIYLGFSRKMSRAELADCLQQTTVSPDFLMFVPVHTGDYFEIDPCVPHAIGPGVTLLEPQRVIAGRSGKTFRMWDWGRTGRALHLQESLALVQPERQVGQAFVDSLRRSPTLQHLAGCRIATFPANATYQLTVISLPKGAVLNTRLREGYAAFTVLEGEVDVSTPSGSLVGVPMGQSGFVPWEALPATWIGIAATSILALVTPTGADPAWMASSLHPS